MRKLALRLIQKYFLKVETDIRLGDLIEHRDDPGFIAESLGIYYSRELRPFLFFRTREGFISNRPLYEFRRCSNVNILTEGNR